MPTRLRKRRRRNIIKPRHHLVPLIILLQVVPNRARTRRHTTQRLVQSQSRPFHRTVHRVQSRVRIIQVGVRVTRRTNHRRMIHRLLLHRHLPRKHHRLLPRTLHHPVLPQRWNGHRPNLYLVIHSRMVRRIFHLIRG